MRLLLDTHILLWAAVDSPKLGEGRLPAATRRLLEDENNELVFSAASIWEVTIKNGLGRPDFQFDPGLLARSLVGNGYTELRVSSAHAVTVAELPDHHRDPFDRLLLAQAKVEGMQLLTNDGEIAKYKGWPVRLAK